jgi:hypothetical protein
MTTPDTSNTPEPAKDASVGEIEADIERTRSALGETVEHLAEKFDVKGRAKHRIEEVKSDVVGHVDDAVKHVTASANHTKDALTDDTGRPNQKGWVAVAVAVSVIGAVVFALTRRGR